jgi:hypothetical protein
MTACLSFVRLRPTSVQLGPQNAKAFFYSRIVSRRNSIKDYKVKAALDRRLWAVTGHDFEYLCFVPNTA